ncbi:MAG: PilZ domain-containing protein [Kofleriaceae bacterium]
MSRATPTPLIEVYLVLEQPSQRIGYWTKALMPLDDRSAPPLAMVAAYYDPTVDQALIALRYDELALDANRIAFAIEIALLAEAGMIQPAELSEGERRRFLGERLQRCTIFVGDQRRVTSALTELVRRIRDVRAGTQTIPARPRAASQPRATSAPPIARTQASPPPIPIARTSSKRLPSNDPSIINARGTRDDLEPLDRPRFEPIEPLERPRQELARPRYEPIEPIEALEPPAPRREVSRLSRPDELRTTSQHVIARPPERAKTVEASAQYSQRIAEGRSPLPASAGESANQFVAEPFLPKGTRDLPTTIYARFLRGGRWVPSRIGTLSLKGAALLTGALPRVHDQVDVALTFGNHRALVRGAVGKVSSVQEAAMSGASTFSVAFQLDDVARRQLTALLTAARAANVTIKPPPPRTARRYPVEWPVNLGTLRGAVRSDALDVSRDGMFIRPSNPLTLDSTLNFSSVLDDGGPPVAGRGKVVRQISEFEARTCGLTVGYGVCIVEMSSIDRSRWLAFLRRIEKRGDKRVLIGASPGRLAELHAGLAAAGYAVTSGSDPGALVQLAGGDARPVDAAVIDGAWLTPDVSATWVESLFAARNVPCITLHGDARRARAAVDKLLIVE